MGTWTTSIHADPADMPEASYSPDMAAAVDCPEESSYREACESYSRGGLAGWVVWRNADRAEHGRGIASETLAKVFPIIIKPGNVRLRVWALMFAFNFEALNGVTTQTAAAKLLGVTRAAMSKGVQFWIDYFGIRRNAHTKSAEAVISYHEVQKDNHWRRQSVGKT